MAESDRALKRKYFIKFPSEDFKIYLYARHKSGPQKFIAKLQDLDKIAMEMGLSREDALKKILKLLEERKKRTSKIIIKDIIELILFDPSTLFDL